MFDMVTQHRQDGELTYEDLVIPKAICLLSCVVLLSSFELPLIVNTYLLLFFRQPTRKEPMMRLLKPDFGCKWQ